MVLLKEGEARPGLQDIYSEKELELLQRLADGYGNTEIGEALFYSPGYIKKMREMIGKKTRTNNYPGEREEADFALCRAISYCIENDLIENHHGIEIAGRPLSRGESSVTALISDGKSYSQTAQSLNYSVKTVKKYFSQALDKLGVNNKYSATAKFVDMRRKGLVQSLQNIPDKVLLPKVL